LQDQHESRKTGWNWAIADRIAKDYKWTEQKPDFDPVPMSEAGWMTAFLLRLAKPRPTSIAPIFWIFFVFSLLSLIVHVALLACVV